MRVPDDRVDGWDSREGGRECSNELCGKMICFRNVFGQRECHDYKSVFMISGPLHIPSLPPLPPSIHPAPPPPLHPSLTNTPPSAPFPNTTPLHQQPSQPSLPHPTPPHPSIHPSRSRHDNFLFLRRAIIHTRTCTAARRVTVVRREWVETRPFGVSFVLDPRAFRS